VNQPIYLSLIKMRILKENSGPITYLACLRLPNEGSTESLGKWHYKQVIKTDLWLTHVRHWGLQYCKANEYQQLLKNNNNIGQVGLKNTTHSENASPKGQRNIETRIWKVAKQYKEHKIWKNASGLRNAYRNLVIVIKDRIYPTQINAHANTNAKRHKKNWKETVQINKKLTMLSLVQSVIFKLTFKINLYRIYLGMRQFCL